MPVPALLLWGTAIALGTAGAKKGYDAHSDSKKADEIVEKAEKKYNRIKESLSNSENETKKVLGDLGRLKTNVFSNQIKHIVDMQKRFRSQLTGFDQKIFLENIPECEVAVEKSLQIEKGLVKGAAAGAMASVGAFGAVGALATASTGTAIGSLSGVAATNATLAWLGGGSLAAGGFGMTGGMIALGGIAAAPLLAIGGFWAASRAEEKKTKAYKYSADVDKAVEEINTVMSNLRDIRTGAAEQADVIRKCVARFERVKVYDMRDRDAFMQMMVIGKGLKQILDIPVILNNGTANKHIRQQCEGCLKLS